MKIFAVSGNHLYLCPMDNDVTRLVRVFTHFKCDVRFDYDFRLVDGKLKVKTKLKATPIGNLTYLTYLTNAFDVLGISDNLVHISVPSLQSDLPSTKRFVERKDIVFGDIVEPNCKYVVLHNALTQVMTLHILVDDLFLEPEIEQDYSAEGIVAFVSELNDQLYRLQGADFDVVPETVELTVTFNYTGQPTIKFLGLTLYDPDCGVAINEFGYDQIKANINEVTALIGKFKCA